MKSPTLTLGVALAAALSIVSIASFLARTPAFAEPDGPLPSIFHPGAMLVGANVESVESLRILEVRGKWVRAQREGGATPVWIAPEQWIRWHDAEASNDPSVNAALVQLATFGAAIESYKLQKRALPKSLEDLTQQDERSRQSYIESGKIPLDPWGKAYEYRVKDGPRPRYEITSCGPDMLMGTDDDVHYPEREVGK